MFQPRSVCLRTRLLSPPRLLSKSAQTNQGPEREKRCCACTGADVCRDPRYVVLSWPCRAVPRFFLFFVYRPLFFQCTVFCSALDLFISGRRAKEQSLSSPHCRPHLASCVSIVIVTRRVVSLPCANFNSRSSFLSFFFFPVGRMYCCFVVTFFIGRFCSDMGSLSDVSLCRP